MSKVNAKNYYAEGEHDEPELDIQDDDLRLDHIPDAKESRQLLAKFKAQGFWPNVYHVNERGNVDLLRLTTRGARIVQSWV